MGMQEYAPQLRPDLFEGHYATMRDQRWPEREWEQESVDTVYTALGLEGRMVFGGLIFGLIHHNWEHAQAQVTAPQRAIEIPDLVGIWLAEQRLTCDDFDWREDVER